MQIQNIFCQFFLKLGFNSCKAEEPLRGMEFGKILKANKKRCLQEPKDEKYQLILNLKLFRS